MDGICQKHNRPIQNTAGQCDICIQERMRMFRDPVVDPDPEPSDVDLVEQTINLVGRARVQREGKVAKTIQRLTQDPDKEPPQGLQELALMANSTPRHRSTRRLERLQHRVWRTRRAISRMAHGRSLALRVASQDLAAVKAHLLATIQPESMIKMILMLEGGGRP